MLSFDEPAPFGLPWPCLGICWVDGIGFVTFVSQSELVPRPFSELTLI